MTIRFGYLLPTRERVMEGRPGGVALVDLARRAEALGYDSVWVGDSLLARPRHEPLTVLAAVAGATTRVVLGTAVLLPALRNPVLLAHQVATLDQVSAGRVILGVGSAADVPNVRAEFAAAGVPFEKRLGRMLEGLRLARALWTGEPVSWEGRWTVSDGRLGPIPHQPGGPPIWVGSGVPAGLERAGRAFDGWFPTGPDAETYAERWRTVRAAAQAAGRPADAVTGAVYLTVAVDEDGTRGQARIDQFLEDYYGQPAALMRKRQACFGGPAEQALEWVRRFVEGGARHLVLRFAGDHDLSLELWARLREGLG